MQADRMCVRPFACLEPSKSLTCRNHASWRRYLLGGGQNSDMLYSYSRIVFRDQYCPRSLHTNHCDSDLCSS